MGNSVAAAASVVRDEELLAAKAAAEANTAAAVAAAAQASHSVATAADAAVAAVKVAAAAADTQLQQKLAAITGGHGNITKVKLASRDSSTVLTLFLDAAQMFSIFEVFVAAQALIATVLYDLALLDKAAAISPFDDACNGYQESLFCR